MRAKQFVHRTGARSRKPTLMQILEHYYVIIGIISFIGGLLTAGVGTTVWFTRTIATNPSVEVSIESLRRYTDKEITQVKAELRDYSDTNRRKTLMDMDSKDGETRIKIEQLSGDMKAMNTKQDLMLESLRAIQTTQTIQTTQSIQNQAQNVLPLQRKRQ